MKRGGQPDEGTTVTNDAKLGFLAGIAGVLVVAVVYFQKGPVGVAAAPENRAAVAGAVSRPVASPAAVIGPAESKAARLPMPDDR
jgi:hypothetical protein